MLAHKKLREKKLNDEIKDLNLKQLHLSKNNEYLKLSEANSNSKLENLAQSYEELRSTHVEMTQSYSFTNKSTTKLEKEVKDNDVALVTLTNE